MALSPNPRNRWVAAMKRGGADDIATLKAAIAGTTYVYDVRYGITTVAGPKVSSWAEADGAGPALAQGVDASRPDWDAANLLVKSNNSASWLTTPASATWALDGARSMVYVGNITTNADATADYILTISDSSAGNRFMALHCPPVGTNIFRANFTGGATAASTVATGATIRCAIVSKNATTTGSIEVPDDTRASSAVTATAAGNNSLILFSFSIDGALGAAVGHTCRAILVLDHEVSAGEVATITNWAVAYHTAVAA